MPPPVSEYILCLRRNSAEMLGRTAHSIMPLSMTLLHQAVHAHFDRTRLYRQQQRSHLRYTTQSFLINLCIFHWTYFE